MTAGGSAAFVGTPAEVALIRSVSDWLSCEGLKVFSIQKNFLITVFRSMTLLVNIILDESC